MDNSPSPALAKLAEAIRRHRKRAGLTQAQLAEFIPCSDKTISAIETGRERPSRQMATAIEREPKVSENALLDIFDLLESESLPGWMRDWVVEERRSGRLRSFELAIVPGLLQTEDYARALLNGNETAVRRGWNARRSSTATSRLHFTLCWMRWFCTARSADDRSCTASWLTSWIACRRNSRFRSCHLT